MLKKVDAQMDITINYENAIVFENLKSILDGIVINKIAKAYREDVVEVVFE